MAVLCGVDYAVQGDIPELKRLWRLCFPEDTPEGIGSFFHEVFRPEDCLVYREEARPVSMAFLLPARLHTPEGLFPIHYLYAAATRPDRQGLGLFQQNSPGIVPRGPGTGGGGFLSAAGGRRFDRILFPFWLPAFFPDVGYSEEKKRRWQGAAYSDDTEEYCRCRARCLSSREWWVEWPGSPFFPLPYRVR